MGSYSVHKDESEEGSSIEGLFTKAQGLTA